MSQASFSLLAADDLERIADHVAKDKPQAARHLIDLLEERCRLLADSPEIGALRPEFPGSIRSSTIGNYVIYYREIANGIEVVRVIHGARNIKSLS